MLLKVRRCWVNTDTFHSKCPPPLSTPLLGQYFLEQSGLSIVFKHSLFSAYCIADKILIQIMNGWHACIFSYIISLALYILCTCADTPDLGLVDIYSPQRWPGDVAQCYIVCECRFPGVGWFPHTSAGGGLITNKQLTLRLLISLLFNYTSRSSILLSFCQHWREIHLGVLRRWLNRWCLLAGCWVFALSSQARGRCYCSPGPHGIFSRQCLSPSTPGYVRVSTTLFFCLQTCILICLVSHVQL